MTVIVGHKFKGGVILASDSQGTAGTDKCEYVNQKVFIKNGIGYGISGSFLEAQILYHYAEEIENKRGSTLEYIVHDLIPMWKRILKEHGALSSADGVDSGEFSMLVAFNGEIFEVSGGNFQVLSAHEYYMAIGGGSSYALGALLAIDFRSCNLVCDITDADAVAIVNCAIKAAIQYDTTCGGTVQYAVIKK